MKPFTTATVILLSAISIAHLLRLAFGWQVTVVDGVVPLWVSGVGAVVAAVLATMVWRESRKP